MATNEETDELNPDTQYPLLIIYEHGDGLQRSEDQIEPLTDHSRSRQNQRDGARGAHMPGRRAGRQQRWRARGFRHNTTEQAGFDDRGGDSCSGQEKRGRGRARTGRPYRGRVSGSRYQSSDRRFEDFNERHVGKDISHRRGTRANRYLNVDTRSSQESEMVFDSKNEDRRTFAKGERMQRFSESKLIALSESKGEPDILLLEVDKMSTGFMDILKKPLEPNLVYHVIGILNIISRSTQTFHLRNILREVDSHMLSNLTEVLFEVSMKDRKFENLWNEPSNIEKFLLNIIEVTKAIMTNLSPSLAKCLSLITAIRRVREKLSLHSIDLELEGIETLFEKVKVNKEMKEIKQRQVPSSTEGKTEPPNSFREIPIFPELSDLQVDERPFLRANKVRGKYDNLDTYLDVQFRLLREDYIQPLRKGISEYRDCIKSGGNVRKVKELKLYFSVKIMYPVCSGKGINHVIQFDTSQFKTMRWASSRRLLHGSLLCLSNNDFDSILYATVTGRDELQLKNGKLEVHFENIHLFENQRNKVFIMAETSAYFEAYRFILEGLQEIESNMPFERYLVNCETTVKPPAYLLSAGGPHYDFSKLLVDESDSNLFPVLNIRQWPKAFELGLDASQYEALQRAITKELAIIQGPPGTGKTFVGLKIAQLLLHNQQSWQKVESSTDILPHRKKTMRKTKGCPILVVCYTNHALDQFLEGIIEMGNAKIVRIGGRCKNESIKPYVLRNLKQERKESREFSRLSENCAQCIKELKECEAVIEKCNVRMKKSETQILQYRTLMSFMTEAQQDAFESSHTEEDLQTTCLSKWLGFHSIQRNDTNLSYDEQIKVIWREYILKEVSAMHDDDQHYISDILALELIQRAELYKAWVADVVSNVRNLLQQDQSKQVQLLNGDYLNSVLRTADSSILEADLMIRYATRHDTKRQLAILLRNSTPVSQWLCLSQNISQIKTVLEENVDRLGYSNQTDNDVEVNTEDIEEERALDEEDDFLYRRNITVKRAKASVEVKSDEWLRNWNEKSFSNKVRQLLTKAKPMKSQEAEKWIHVLDLSDQVRRNLYAFWIESYRRYLKENVKVYEEKYNEATEKLQEVRNMETVDILKDSEIIGITTTGAAKHRKVLQSVRPQIIIVEEAAEVLESHIITTLNESCQHLILIGDHKQLRPSTTVYALAKKYHMDISLFERMVCNSVPCVTLEEQHRMRPDISILLTHESLYPKLRDHPSVRDYEDVKGIDNNVQFITHEEEEVNTAESTSYSNPHEAKYLAMLCRYLLRQGYQRDQISVITPYMGQVLLLRKEMPKSDFEGVRITAVDNFQGEENEIILLSLVRSRQFENIPQKRNPIGFVGIENRICVSLSRAKIGFYVIGNFRLLEHYSEMWSRMITMMRQKKLIRDGLRLRCQNHPDMVSFAQTVADFKNVPEGGCSRSCNAMLLCGHMCPLNCHPVDRDHQHFLCLKPCEQIICSNNHKCTKHCYEPCGQCRTVVQKTIPMCGHTASMACHLDPYKWKCEKTCEFKSPCSHSCKRKCSECTEEKAHEKECKVMVNKILECGHEKSMKCHDDPSEVDCYVSCETLLDCNHRCSGSCGNCFGGKIHKGCNASCEKILPCGHKCSFPCSEFCPPCTKPCDFACSHGTKCKKRCYEKCTPCYGPCKFNCDKHKIKCTLPCNEPCEMQPCSEPCKKTLLCKKGHGICKGICTEKCFCTICQKDKIRLDPGDTVKDNMVFIKLPNCNCIIEIGRFKRFINQEPGDGHKCLYKQCPHCGVAITRHIRPFTNVFKTTRENIVREYEMHVGTLDERMSKITKLRREFQQLERKGLTSQEVIWVIEKLQIYNFGAIRYTDDMKGRLLRLLEIYDFMEMSQSSVRIAADHTKGIVKASKLRDTLLRGKRFVTKQFWQEIDRELKRIHVWAKFYVMNERLESVGKAASETSGVFTAAFKIISRKEFGQADEKLLSAVYKSVFSMFKEGFSATGFDNIKTILDDHLKLSIDVSNAEVELGSDFVELPDETPV